MNASRRFLLALCLALAFHLGLAIFVTPKKAPPRVVSLHVERIVLLHRRRQAKPRPRPTPVPRSPTPRPVVVHHLEKKRTIAAAGARAAGPPRTHHGGAHRHAAPQARPFAPRRELAVPTQRPALPAPFHPAAVAGSGSGTGSRQGNGGGAAGTVVGAGGSGTAATGSGGAGGVQICGDVFLTRFGPIKFVHGRPHVSIRAKIEYSDGTTSTQAFPYDFVYQGNQDNPFSAQNENNPEFPVLVQQPPPGFDSVRLPTVIRLVLAHTPSVDRVLPDGSILQSGRTDLDPCPALPTPLATRS